VNRLIGCAWALSRLGRKAGRQNARQQNPRPQWRVALHCLITINLLAATAVAQGDEISQLIAQGQFTVSSEISPSEPVVPGQRLKLIIKVATPRWFTDGTQIQKPEVPGLVILQTQDFAANASEQRDGQNWTVQRWILDVFATAPGRFTLPPIAVTVSVSTSPGRSIQGTALAPATQVVATLAPPLEGIEQWIASPELTLEQTLEGLPEDGVLAVGAAVRRQISIKAAQVMAMMLPPPAMDPVQGLQIYAEPPILRSDSNRGALNAERRDVVTYIATESGQTVLPEIRLQWWHTEQHRLTTVTLPAIPITVSDARVIANDWSAKALLTGKILAGFVLIALLVWWARRHTMLGQLKRIARRLRKQLIKRWRQLRAPALAKRLNPDGSAGVLEATSPREQ